MEIKIKSKRCAFIHTDVCVACGCCVKVCPLSAIQLLDFWAPWCVPCRMVGPILEEIAAERSDIKVGKVNVDEQPELAGQFSVMSIPTLVVMKNGKVVNQAVGTRPKGQILAII